MFGKNISNPLVLAAGFDKHAEAIEDFLDLGFGAVEVGSVTPLPQVCLFFFCISILLTNSYKLK